MPLQELKIKNGNECQIQYFQSISKNIPNDDYSVDTNIIEL